MSTPRCYRRSFRWIALLLILPILWCSTFESHAAEPPAPSSDDLKFFESKVRPLLVSKCIDCHGEDTQESELRLDTYAGMISGGTSGPAIVPGSLEESLLLTAVSFKHELLQMPPDGKLAADEIQLLQQWVEKGAPHPESGAAGSITPRRGAIDLEEARKYWAFQPIVRPKVPEVAGQTAKPNPIDAFTFSHLQKQGLTPSSAADKRTLLRRATLDLIGLPPTPEEIAAFLADETPSAFEHVIDRLLSSPRYGERWGRHWLDVVRYADSNGLDENQGFVDAWRYRNYVIDAFNADKPYDRFLQEQVAGDLLEKAEQRSETSGDYSAVIATGFLTLGPKVLAEKDPVKMEMDIIDEQIDTFSQAFLGMTIACARCHDHKFDPIYTADYYALAGIFKSTKSMQNFTVIAKYNERTLATEEEIKRKAELDAQRKTKQTELNALVKAANAALLKESGAEAGSAVPADVEQKYPAETKTQLDKLREEIAQLTAAAPELPTAMAVEEGTAADTQIHVRGSHLMLGRSVERGVPAVMNRSGALEIGESESGRLQLARWLTSEQNPLTARVAVNRIWGWHFGEALAPTTDNFGRLGEAPTQPELLDWLAVELRENGWSIKKLQKQIMLSETYQFSSQAIAKNEQLDPENKEHWRANVQRMDAESLRDSLLAVSGLLDTSRGESVLDLPKWKLVFDHTSKDATTYDTYRRSIYLPVIRNNMYDGFSLFDFATADVTTGSRGTSTVAPQALYAMNSKLFLSASEGLAKRLIEEFPSDVEARVPRLYEITLGRLPQPHEVERLLKYAAQLEPLLQTDAKIEDPHRAAWSAVCQSVLASNEFTYVE
ncbi:PSD1 and planctomycete cytochrome C domain-containing protein [Blastopirellula sp. J2-11]|uniref:PSD1 and planctomycete cytochrome C domain-containing protein n=1 Tax=Blastopirellula sp. J2-11 TaxID=2943192 RepID=UPI0021C6AA6D|nr:PSD1 and planctomycete cytochrome C domain-containing protein [Blastopirellula sp. J2-11]UUO04941.1 PSD1 and planctomycete cytochrome C domain-containing protein [Blastopirellula sp. J2-11]